MANTKHVTVDQTQQIITAFATKADARFLKQADIATYTIKQQSEAETGFAATYQLFSQVIDGSSTIETPVGAKINIPKDMVVSSGSVVDITFDSETNKLYDGDVDVTSIIKGESTPTAADAGKYIKLVVANATNDKIYIKATDLVDVYTGGDGIVITNGEISVDIDSNNANGLSVDSTTKKIKMAVADTTTTGALSSTDWNTFNDKQDTVVAGNGIAIGADGVTISANVDTANANGLTVDASGLKNNLAVPATSYVAATGTYVSGTTYYTSASGAATVDTSDFVEGETSVVGYYVAQANTASNGALSAADKQKIDGIETASAADITAIINSIWA